MRAALSFDAFRQTLAEKLGIAELASASGEADLEHDLQIDSLRAVQLAVSLGELGWNSSGEQLPQIRNLRELHAAYVAGLQTPTEPDRAGAATPTASSSYAHEEPARTELSVQTWDRTVPRLPVLERQPLYFYPVERSDIPFLYRLATAPETGYRWRFRGGVPSREVFEATLWNSILVQFVVCQDNLNKPIGLVVCLQPDHSSGYAYLSTIFTPEVFRSGFPATAVQVFVEYLFSTYTFRKLYMEAPAFNYGAFSSGEGWLFTTEGRLRNHRFALGRYWDEYILAIYRDTVLSGPQVAGKTADTAT